jgi:hypothetical protein
MPYTEIHLVSGEKLRVDMPVAEVAEHVSVQSAAPTGFCHLEMKSGTVLIRPETVAFLEQHGTG